jgi:hypothetical protein
VVVSIKYIESSNKAGPETGSLKFLSGDHSCDLDENHLREAVGPGIQLKQVEIWAGL